MTDLIHVRAFPAHELSLSDGRLFGRLVPYNVTTMVLDRLPDGRVDIYREGFRPASFRRQVASTEPGVVRRIGLVHTHQGGLGYLGPMLALQERADGVYGDIHVLRSRRDDVAELLEQGIKALSIEYRERPNSTEVDSDGVRWRTDAHIDQVALEAKGAYTEAQVLAYRAELDQLAADAAKAQKDDETAAAEAAAVQARLETEAEEQAEIEAQRRQRAADLDAYLAAEATRQAELEARYLSSAR